MGHYAGEMPRTQGELQAEEIFQRSLDIKEKIKDLPLGLFRVDDLEPLVKLFARTGDWLNRDEVERLESRLKEIESGEVPFPPNP